MSQLLKEQQDSICWLSINRPEKHNAFDDVLLKELKALLADIEADQKTDVLVLKANGKHFSAGADLGWMQRMANFSEEENLDDALVLAEVMYALHHSSKTTISMVQGAAYGGGAGLAAVTDICIAADNSRFCFSEVRLGLIPAVISPYVIKAIGERASNALFLSAEVFDAGKAKALGLVHHTSSEAELLSFTEQYARQIAANAPQALKDCKQMVRKVAAASIDTRLMRETAELIAKKRVSTEGQTYLHAFLNKEKTN